MKKLQHTIEYVFLVLFTHFVRLFPLNFARFVIVIFANIVYYIIPVRRKVVLNNLKASFGDSKSKNEIRHIARKSYSQFAQTMIELMFFPKLTKEWLIKNIDVQGYELLDSAIENGKGAILVGAHFCNWELMAAVIGQKYPLTLVVGQQHNIYSDNILNSYRLGKGVKIMPLRMSLRGVIKTLSKNEFIAIVSDQDAHEDGTFVNFFGRPASTPKGPAMFSFRTKSPILTGHIFRLTNGKFKLIFETVPTPELSGDTEKDINAYTQNYTNILEKHVRSHPDHWFWMHRRWKTKKVNNN